MTRRMGTRGAGGAAPPRERRTQRRTAAIADVPAGAVGGAAGPWLPGGASKRGPVAVPRASAVAPYATTLGGPAGGNSGDRGARGGGRGGREAAAAADDGGRPGVTAGAATRGSTGGQPVASPPPRIRTVGSCERQTDTGVASSACRPRSTATFSSTAAGGSGSMAEAAAAATTAAASVGATHRASHSAGERPAASTTAARRAHVRRMTSGASSSRELEKSAG